MIWGILALGFLVVALIWSAELMAQRTWNDSSFVVVAWLITAAMLAGWAFS